MEESKGKLAKLALLSDSEEESGEDEKPNAGGLAGLLQAKKEANDGLEKKVKKKLNME